MASAAYQPMSENWPNSAGHPPHRTITPIHSGHTLQRPGSPLQSEQLPVCPRNFRESDQRLRIDTDLINLKIYRIKFPIQASKLFSGHSELTSSFGPRSRLTGSLKLGSRIIDYLPVGKRFQEQRKLSPLPKQNGAFVVVYRRNIS